MDHDKRLQQSTWVMRIVGLAMVAGFPVFIFAYPAGFLWGSHPDWPMFLGHHPASALSGLHPYLFMIIALYLALGVLLVKGADDPVGNKALFDFAILSSILHGAVMVVQAFCVEHEMAHLWADIPVLFALAGIMWFWHPSRTP